MSKKKNKETISKFLKKLVKAKNKKAKKIKIVKIKIKQLKPKDFNGLYIKRLKTEKGVQTMTERTVFIHESSKTLHWEDTEECNLSYKEQIEKAKKDCIECSACNTMSPTYLQAFKLYADRFDVLDQWKFIIIKDDGTSVDVTNNTEVAFAMMAKPLDDLFNVEINR